MKFHFIVKVILCGMGGWVKKRVLQKGLNEFWVTSLKKKKCLGTTALKLTWFILLFRIVSLTLCRAVVNHLGKALKTFTLYLRE